MQNPLNIKEFGNWIWEMIQKVFAFFLKPLGGIMMALVLVVGGAFYGDWKNQSGYEQGMENQRIADSIYINQQASVITDLKIDKKDLQARIDTIKNIDCIEENRKAFAYVENLKKEIEQYNESKNEKLKTVTTENKAVKSEIKTLENLIRKTQKQ